MPAPIDIVGKKFGRLTVLSRATGSMWLTVCDCGNEKVVRGTHLKKGMVSSCRCLQRERLVARSRTHGMSDTRTHNIWMKMRQRCEQKSCPAWPDYGGRGISVCDRWKNFASFVEDMGEAPPGLSIDRVDNNAGYSKSNCRWATAREQARNRRSNVIVDVGGKGMLLADVVGLSTVGRATLTNRLRSGWDVAEAMSKPSRNKHQRGRLLADEVTTNRCCT